jgi:hypothetical protein
MEETARTPTTRREAQEEEEEEEEEGEGKDKEEGLEAPEAAGAGRRTRMGAC